MSKVQTCKRCLYQSDHPLGLIIDDDGICSGCRIHEEKDILDWGYRWNILEKLVRNYRSKTPHIYDCIVPVSGAQDSYYILHIVKNKLKLNPLIVTYNKYWNTPLGIHNLANLRTKFNCDILIQNVNPLSVKKIVKTTLHQLGSIYWHCIAGQTVFPIQTAVRYKIPLIIWGAHQGMEQTGMFSHKHDVEMSRRYRKDHDLMGMEADDLLSNFDTLTEEDIWQYRYPSDKDISSIGIRGIYLNNYVRWDPKSQHEEMINLYNYKTAKFNRTFDCYDFVDCYNYMNLHDKIKYYKHGYGKVLDHASREIRHGRLSREDAKLLVKIHQEQPIQYIDLFCEWLGVDPEGLQFVLDLHRNPMLWERNFDTGWKQKENLSFPPLSDKFYSKEDIPIHFIDNATLNLNKDKKYITVGKGWP